MVTIGDDMVDPMKPQEYRKKEEMTTENALHEKAVIDSLSETLESNTTSIIIESQKTNRSFFGTAMVCVPYVIMIMGAYMIWTRARALFKSDKREESEG